MIMINKLNLYNCLPLIHVRYNGKYKKKFKTENLSLFYKDLDIFLCQEVLKTDFFFFCLFFTFFFSLIFFFLHFICHFRIRMSLSFMFLSHLCSTRTLEPCRFFNPILCGVCVLIYRNKLVYILDE